MTPYPFTQTSSRRSKCQFTQAFVQSTKPRQLWAHPEAQMLSMPAHTVVAFIVIPRTCMFEKLFDGWRSRFHILCHTCECLESRICFFHNCRCRHCLCEFSFCVFLGYGFQCRAIRIARILASAQTHRDEWFCRVLFDSCLPSGSFLFVPLGFRFLCSVFLNSSL